MFAILPITMMIAALFVLVVKHNKHSWRFWRARLFGERMEGWDNGSGDKSAYVLAYYYKGKTYWWESR